MSAQEKRKLVPRGAPMAPMLMKQHLHEQNLEDRNDSGLGDSYKSEKDSMTLLDEIDNLSINENTKQLVCDDASTNSRHPEPCTTTSTTTSTSGDVRYPSPFNNMWSFAQSNDIRHLLAPYRNHLQLQNEDGDTPIHLAVIHNQPVIEGFVSIVPNKEWLNIYNFLRQTPLHLAAITGQSPIVNLLLQAGARIDMVDRNGKTALHLACERGDMRTVEVLTHFLVNTYGHDSMEVDILLNARDYKGFSALHLAVKESQYDVISHLVSLGANVDLEDATSGRTALHLAVESNSLKMVNFLLHNCCASVNAQRRDESTALHIAAGRGMIAITGRLLASGGDLSISNSDGETPLDHATPEVLSILKELL